MKVLIIGKNSFIAKNFINKYSKKIKIYYFNMYFPNNHKKYIEKIFFYANKKKINHIISFIGNNDNSQILFEQKNILRDNFVLPLSLVDVFKKKNINFTFFLSAEINKIESEQENNLYALSKFFLKDSMRFISRKNNISFINIKNVYGPHDLNFNRLIPALMLKFLLKKKNIKIKLSQNKKLIYVHDMLPIIFNSIKNKKSLKIINIEGKKFNILKLWNFINKISKNKNIVVRKKNIYYSFIETLNWYKKNLNSIKKYHI